MTFLLYLAMFFAILNWISVARLIKPLEYFSKPATMITLLAWVGLNGGFRGPMLWFALGLLFSLGGDVFLMLPRDLFIAGLLSFLVGHLCYVIGFNQGPPSPLLLLLILAVLVFIAAAQIFRRIRRGLIAAEKRALQFPVMIYTMVISLMLISALSTLARPDWSFTAAILSGLGALSFFTSDTILAWDKFVAPLRHARLRTMTTYHLGQFLITLGAALHFLGGG
jgi:uncharacterized membrane protein YhhN